MIVIKVNFVVQQWPCSNTGSIYIACIISLQQEVGEWIKSCKSSKLAQAANNLKKELKKLEPPSSVVNPSKSASSVSPATKTASKAGPSSSVESAV